MNPPLAQIRLNASRPVGEHPWVFLKNLVKNPEVRNGGVADLVSADGAFLARGFYNGHARIGFRVLSRDPNTVIDKAFFADRLRQAYNLRVALRPELRDGSKKAFRLCYSEADQLSGLVIDIYDDLGVLQFYAAGPYRFRNDLLEILTEEYGCKDFYWFAERHIQKQESFDCRYPQRELPHTTIIENGVIYKVAPSVHHKTGFFVDQRQNRIKLAGLTAGKSVLDLCCFTGGFALAAAKAGAATKVTAIDLDPDAVEIVKINAQLNEVSQIDPVVADIYQWLDRPWPIEDQYDVVILDPAKLTKTDDRREQALNQYTRINQLALQALKPGGLFLTCSCSGLISEADFIDAVRRAGVHSGASLQVFALTGASDDHPFLMDALNGRYLKAIWARKI